MALIATITGATSPSINGDYAQIADINGYWAFYSSATGYTIWYDSTWAGAYAITVGTSSDPWSGTDPFWIKASSYTTASGAYDPDPGDGGIPRDAAVGTVSVSVFFDSFSSCSSSLGVSSSSSLGVSSSSSLGNSSSSSSLGNSSSSGDRLFLLCCSCYIQALGQAFPDYMPAGYLTWTTSEWETWLTGGSVPADEAVLLDSAFIPGVLDVARVTFPGGYQYCYEYTQHVHRVKPVDEYTALGWEETCDDCFDSIVSSSSSSLEISSSSSLEVSSSSSLWQESSSSSLGNSSSSSLEVSSSSSGDELVYYFLQCEFYEDGYLPVGWESWDTATWDAWLAAEPRAGVLVISPDPPFPPGMGPGAVYKIDTVCCAFIHKVHKNGDEDTYTIGDSYINCTGCLESSSSSSSSGDRLLPLCCSCYISALGQAFPDYMPAGYLTWTTSEWETWLTGGSVPADHAVLLDSTFVPGVLDVARVTFPGGYQYCYQFVAYVNRVKDVDEYTALGWEESCDDCFESIHSSSSSSLEVSSSSSLGLESSSSSVGVSSSSSRGVSSSSSSLVVSSSSSGDELVYYFLQCEFYEGGYLPVGWESWDTETWDAWLAAEPRAGALVIEPSPPFPPGMGPGAVYKINTICCAFIHKVHKNGDEDTYTIGDSYINCTECLESSSSSSSVGLSSSSSSLGESSSSSVGVSSSSSVGVSSSSSGSEISSSSSSVGVSSSSSVGISSSSSSVGVSSSSSIGISSSSSSFGISSSSSSIFDSSESSSSSLGLSSSSSSESSSGSSGITIFLHVSVAENPYRHYAAVAASENQYFAVSFHRLLDQVYPSWADGYALSTERQQELYDIYVEDEEWQRKAFDPCVEEGFTDGCVDCDPKLRSDQVYDEHLAWSIGRHITTEIGALDVGAETEDSLFEKKVLNFNYDAMNNVWITPIYDPPFDFMRDANFLWAISGSTDTVALFAMGSCCRVNSINKIPTIHRSDPTNKNTFVDSRYCEIGRVFILNDDPNILLSGLSFEMTANVIPCSKFVEYQPMSYNYIHSIAYDSTSRLFCFYETINEEVGTGTIGCTVSYDDGVTWYEFKDVLALSPGEIARNPQVVYDNKNTGLLKLFFTLSIGWTSLQEGFLCVKDIDPSLFDKNDAYKIPTGVSPYAEVPKNEGIEHYTPKGRAMLSTPITLLDGKFDTLLFLPTWAYSPTSEGNRVRIRFGHDPNTIINNWFNNKSSISGILDSHGVLRLFYLHLTDDVEPGSEIYDKFLGVKSSYDGGYSWVDTIKYVNFFNMSSAGVIEEKDIRIQGIYDELVDCISIIYCRDGALFIRCIEGNWLKAIEGYNGRDADNQLDSEFQRQLITKAFAPSPLEALVNPPVSIAGESPDGFSYINFNGKDERPVMDQAQPDGYATKRGFLKIFYWTWEEELLYVTLHPAYYRPFTQGEK